MHKETAPLKTRIYTGLLLGLLGLLLRGEPVHTQELPPTWTLGPKKTETAVITTPVALPQVERPDDENMD